MALAERSVERATTRGSGTYRIGSRKHRRHARILISLPVDVVTATERRSARCTELGLVSLVLETGPPLAYGERIEILLPGELRVAGVVRWNGFRGYGIQLGSLRVSEARRVIELLRRA